MALVIDPTKFPVGVSTESFEVRSDTGTATVVITITITAPEIRVQPYISYVRGPSELSPGARILVGVVGLDLPDEKWSDISPAPQSWDGLSFRYGSNALPIVASRGAGSFAVQFPYELEVGGSPQRLELFSERDGVLASAPVFGKIAAASIGLVDLGPATVFREDGSAIAADNPARPGERIRISAVGAGIMEPRVSAGELPSDGMTARPLLPITASVSGKSAPVVRQILSATRIGVVDLEIEVPSVYSGKHMLGLMQGNSYVYAIPLHVERCTSNDSGQ